VCYRGHQGAMLNKWCKGSPTHSHNLPRDLHSVPTLNPGPRQGILSADRARLSTSTSANFNIRVEASPPGHVNIFFRQVRRCFLHSVACVLLWQVGRKHHIPKNDQRCLASISTYLILAPHGASNPVSDFAKRPRVHSRVSRSCAASNCRAFCALLNASCNSRIFLPALTRARNSSTLLS
jgi:hypothetical protein